METFHMKKSYTCDKESTHFTPNRTKTVKRFLFMANANFILDVGNIYLHGKRMVSDIEIWITHGRTTTRQLKINSYQKQQLQQFNYNNNNNNKKRQQHPQHQLLYKQ